MATSVLWQTTAKCTMCFRKQLPSSSHHLYKRLRAQQPAQQATALTKQQTGEEKEKGLKTPDVTARKSAVSSGYFQKNTR